MRSQPVSSISSSSSSSLAATVSLASAYSDALGESETSTWGDWFLRDGLNESESGTLALFSAFCLFFALPFSLMLLFPFCVIISIFHRFFLVFVFHYQPPY